MDVGMRKGITMINLCYILVRGKQVQRTNHNIAMYTFSHWHTLPE